jgi:hypothetical protein
MAINNEECVEVGERDFPILGLDTLDEGFLRSTQRYLKFIFYCRRFRVHAGDVELYAEIESKSLSAL